MARKVIIQIALALLFYFIPYIVCLSSETPLSGRRSNDASTSQPTSGLSSVATAQSAQGKL
jgi:hypothetical protein